jgi:hypothetical protein
LQPSLLFGPVLLSEAEGRAGQPPELLVLCLKAGRLGPLLYSMSSVELDNRAFSQALAIRSIPQPRRTIDGIFATICPNAP